MSKYMDMAKSKLPGHGDSSSKSSSKPAGSHGTVTGLGLRNRVSGKIHGGGSNQQFDYAERAPSRPINSLTDPSKFAPPPKRTNTGPLPPAPARRPGASSNNSSQSNQQYLEAEEEEEKPPPQPYRLNTSGLSADHLPPPPGRRDAADGRSPPPYDAALASSGPRATAPGPSLPPRLPARSTAPSASPSPPMPARTNTSSSTGSGMLNTSAANRLGAAGVSVPALGIRGHGSASSPSPPPPPRAAAAPPPPAQSSNAQVNELQNRFAKFSTGSGQSNAGSNEGGTTWAQKQAALKTASSFHKDPSSVSLSDARAAAGTANSFRQRHGDQISAGMKSANSLNQKYGVAERLGGGQTQAAPPSPVAAPAASPVPGLAGKKKPPPPPPKKKPGLSAQVAPADDGAPPPIPMSTRPTF